LNGFFTGGWQQENSLCVVFAAHGWSSRAFASNVSDDRNCHSTNAPTDLEIEVAHRITESRFLFASGNRCEQLPTSSWRWYIMGRTEMSPCIGAHASPRQLQAGGRLRAVSGRCRAWFRNVLGLAPVQGSHDEGMPWGLV